MNGVRAGETASAGERAPRTGVHAFLVAAGILLSRVAGLVRQRVFAHYFGASAAADAFTAAFRIPNFLQNLFGEGVLSASFIPVYSGLLAQGDEREADRVAGIVGSLLALTTSILVLFGVLFAPFLVMVIAPGFKGETGELAVRLTRVLFPGAGLLVLSAWCLGILNSHRRFFLSYTAPVLWNVVMIAGMIGFGAGRDDTSLAVILAWASVVGSAVQFLIQLPAVLRLAPRMRPALEAAEANVRVVIRNFFPVCLGRGVVQISAYVDSLLATLLPVGSVAFLNYAQLLYMLPVSLFGMSVAAAELPAMSRALGGEEDIASALRSRLDRGLRRIAFFVIPSAVILLAAGDVIASALYKTGRFTAEDSRWIWTILAAAAPALPAMTLGRLYSSTFYALRDTRTPVRFAVLRVFLSVALGLLFALVVPPALGLDRRWGVAGLVLAAGIAGWVEFSLLRRTLNRRIGKTGLPTRYLFALVGSALAAAAQAWAAPLLLPGHAANPAAVLFLAAFGAAYLALLLLLRIPEAAQMLRLPGAGRVRSR